MSPIAEVLSASWLAPRPHRLTSNNRDETRRLNLIRFQSRTKINAADPARQLPVVGTVPGFIESVCSVKLLLLQKGQDQNPPAMHWLAIAVGNIGRGEATIVLVIVGDRQQMSFQVSNRVCRAGGVSCIRHPPIEKPEETNNQDHDRNG